MGGWNLPPGVTLEMLDQSFDEGAWEALIDDIYATKVTNASGGENLITPEEARERWESQPKLKEFYEENRRIINNLEVKLLDLSLTDFNTKQLLQIFVDLVRELEKNI